MEKPKRKLAALEMPSGERREPFGDRRAIKLDDFFSVHGSGREIPRENPARPANPFKTLIGGLLGCGYKFDAGDAVIPHNGERPVCRPFAVKEKYFG